MLNHRPPVLGFTLIELMIIIAVLGIMMMAALPAMNTWLGNASIRTNAEAIANGLQLARTEAIRRNSSVRMTLNAAGTGWTINVVSGGELIQERVAEGRAQSVVVTFDPAADRVVTFGPFGTVSDSPPISAIKVDSNAISAADSREMCIMLSAGGPARMCDPRRALTDPQSCQPANPVVCTPTP